MVMGAIPFASVRERLYAAEMSVTCLVNADGQWVSHLPGTNENVREALHGVAQPSMSGLVMTLSVYSLDAHPSPAGDISSVHRPTWFVYCKKSYTEVLVS